MADEPKNPSREDIMKQKPLYCTPENPEPALIPSHNSATDSLDHAHYDPKVEMDKVFKHYLASNPAMALSRSKPELEVRFNGIGGAPLTKIDYDSVIQHLYAAGFRPENPNGNHILRIQSEFVNNRGINAISNIRAEICGIDLIQEYCRTNSIHSLMNLPSTLSASSNKILFTKKDQIKNPDTKRNFFPVDNKEFRFRVGYQNEQELTMNNDIVRNMIESKRWADSKKVFRHLNRVRFTHPEYPVFADITILRSSAKSGRAPIPKYTIQDAKVFQEAETYEVELEIDNYRVGEGMKYSQLPKLLADVRKAIRVVLSAIQGTNYPIAESEMRHVIRTYQRLIHGPRADKEENLSCSFVGPSSRTLQMENIVETRGGSVPNIRYGYTVTDKADGDRKMMLIDDSGKIYFIDMNMRVEGTGAMTAKKALHSSLFDGEHIKHDKTGKFINMFAVFDVYYINKTSIREYPLIHLPDKIREEEEKGAEKKEDPNTRWHIMNYAISELKPFSVLEKHNPKREAGVQPSTSSSSNVCGIRVQCKEFYVGSSKGGSEIFRHCGTILSKSNDGLFEYNTDGLIFTPAEYGVGGKPDLVAGPLYKHTWDMSFKWKPSEFNSVDFLVRVKKDANGREVIGTEFEDGFGASINQFKTLILHCGFDEKKHGYMNPFQQLIDGEFKKRDDPTNDDEEVRPESSYSARPFMPTNPADPKASLCNIMLSGDGGLMRTESGEVFEENMIVEFRYDGTKKGSWRWIPIRVRYDKTAETSSLCYGNRGNAFRKKKQSFGNDYTTADNNWFSIHNPITPLMIRTGEYIPVVESIGEDVYYTRKSGDTTTRGLRDFHNLYVKMRLIGGVANRKDTLIDYAVGKAGDLSKWRAAKLGFVLGIDISKDNIMHRVDGACARYLTEASKYSGMFDAIFLNGNSAQNIRNGDAFEGYKEKMVARAVFGEGPKVRADLGASVYKSFGVASEGFSISSCQFAVHYFFENVRSLHNFARNVSECTRVGGIFVGTCWDGKTVFNWLKTKPCGESFTITRYGTKLFQITKMYDESGFPDDELSLGYPISVYQESIGQNIVEYLVNFEFLRRTMENYGFELLNREEAIQFGFPNGGTGMFDGLYSDMMSEVERNPESAMKYGTAPDMTADEKTISYLNRYFIFRKVRRNIATEKITKLINHALSSKEPTKCIGGPKMAAADGEAESLEEGEIEEEEEPIVEKLSQSFQKREEMKRRFDKPKTPEKAEEAKKKEFIRPIPNTKITIRAYDPPVSDRPQEIVDLPIDDSDPSIKLAPKPVKTGKTIKIPAKKLQK